MPSLFRSHQLVLVDDVLIKFEGDEDEWRSNALINVPDPERFRIEVKPAIRGGGSWGDMENPPIIGIAPSDTDLAQVDIEEHTGVFVFFNCDMHEFQDEVEILMPGQPGKPFALPGWSAARASTTSANLIRMEYQNNELYLAVDGNTPRRVPVPIAIPPADYRPCISIKRKSTRILISVDTPSRKRKAEGGEAPALKVARNLWADREFTDALVTCGSHVIPVHRCVLSAASPFFARAFKGSMRESTEAKVAMDDADPTAVELLLSFLYTGVLDSSADTSAAQILPIAHRLEVPELVDHCASTLVRAMAKDNILSTLSALRPYRDSADVKPHWETIICKIQSDTQLIRALLVTENDPMVNLREVSKQ